MLKLAFDYIGALSGAVASVEGGAKALGGMRFEGLPMIGIAVIAFALAAMHYKNEVNKQVVKVAASNDEMEEIEDDEI